MSVTYVQDRNMLYDISENYNDYDLEWISYRENSLVEESYQGGRISYHGEIYLTFDNQWCYDNSLWKYSSQKGITKLHNKSYESPCYNLINRSNTIYNIIMHEVCTNADYPN